MNNNNSNNNNINREITIQVSSSGEYKETENILKTNNKGIKEREEIVIFNYPRAIVPDTGTLAGLPFLLLSIGLIFISVCIRRTVEN